MNFQSISQVKDGFTEAWTAETLERLQAALIHKTIISIGYHVVDGSEVTALRLQFSDGDVAIIRGYSELGNGYLTAEKETIE